MVERHVVADDRGLADHDARAMINEETAADRRAGMNVDIRHQPSKPRQEPPRKAQSAPPQQMREAVPDQGMHAGIGEQRLERVTRGRIARPRRS